MITPMIETEMKELETGVEAVDRGFISFESGWPLIAFAYQQAVETILSCTGNPYAVDYYMSALLQRLWCKKLMRLFAGAKGVQC